MKILIFVLAMLLVCSLTALAGVYAYGLAESSIRSAVVYDNYITSDSAKETVISIYKNHAEDSKPFSCPNMFPGDSETHPYLVEVSHVGTVTVRFHADIHKGYEKLAEVLKCKVVLGGENQTLYDGLMGDMPESINRRIFATSNQTTKLDYDITVYLDTSVGNEHMNQELVADFRWWVEESGGNPVPPPGPGPDDPTVPDDPTDPDDPADPDNPEKPEEPTDPDEPADSDNPEKPDDPIESDDPADSQPDDGELVPPPKTGDSNRLYIWLCIAMFSLLINIILLWPKRRRNTDEQEDENANEQ